MPKRKINSEEKAIPRLSFKVPVEIVFSLSIDYKTAEDFKVSTGNKDDSVSKGLRDILFDKLGVKNKEGFNNWMFSLSKEAKQKIYNKLGVSRDKSFSQIIVEEMKKYPKNNNGEK